MRLARSVENGPFRPRHIASDIRIGDTGDPDVNIGGNRAAQDQAFCFDDGNSQRVMLSSCYCSPG